jgi:hypothetical protein
MTNQSKTLTTRGLSKRVAKDKALALIACRSCGNFQVLDGRVTGASERLPKLAAHIRALLGNGNLSDHVPSNTFVHCTGARLVMFHVSSRTRRLTIRETHGDAEREAAQQHLAVILRQLKTTQYSGDGTGLDDNS